MLKEKQPYSGLSEREYEERFRQREMNSLQRRAARLGLSLVPTAQTGPFLENSQIAAGYLQTA